MITRRGFLLQGTALTALMALGAGSARADMPRFLSDEPFDATTVEDMARALSQKPYVPRASVPEAWQSLSYDEYRQIRFIPGKAVWSETDLPLNMQLFAPGLYFPQPVEVDVIEGSRAHRLAFDLSLFDTSDLSKSLPVDDTMGYAGLRLHADILGSGIRQEFAVFQGASYFRALANWQNYGLSARGLALGTGDPEGEEFPDFIRFWVETPAADAQSYTIHALLDSPSVSGAYRFEITPGAPLEMEVEVTLFPRVPLDHVGIAPLTSMFLFDQTNRDAFRDFRPAVHDSDGLLMWNGAGEMLWRPLANPARLGVSSFVDNGPRGFGLLQRARRFEDFEDMEAQYHRRPSAWVEPRGDWGPGLVRLVEIPADKEIYDNIVSYWRPREPLEPGEAHRFAYRLSWGEEPLRRRDVARVINTAIGLNFEQDQQLAVIDYEDHPLLRGDIEDFTVHVSSNSAKTGEGLLQRKTNTRGLRLAFSFDPGARDTVEMRAQLLRAGRPVSEVWLYRWSAPA